MRAANLLVVIAFISQLSQPQHPNDFASQLHIEGVQTFNLIGSIPEKMT